MPTRTPGDGLEPYRPPTARRAPLDFPARGVFITAAVGGAVGIAAGFALAMVDPTGTARLALVLTTTGGASVFAGGILYGPLGFPPPGGARRG
jgi:hypothetical protein